MKICKCCGQADISEIKIKKTNEIVYVCDECETLWLSDELNDDDATNLSDFLEKRNLAYSSHEFVVIKKL